ncbi:MAG TPA: PaaI family thioesterase [Polyangiaceae bacterium]|nr:PaaI family thioesterase [Polyangiaceae bacterium]
MPRINPAYVERIKHLVTTAAYPSLLSMRLEDLQLGSCRLTIDVRPEHFQPLGVVHGGVLATLIDTATFWSLFLALEREDDGLASVDLKLNYLAPVFGGTLVATGSQIRMGKRLGYAEAYVTGSDGQIVAHGTSTLMVLPGKGLRIDTPRELDG